MKRHVWILHVFVVGLALHNFAMAELYAAGVRGNALDVVSAWKELLLALGLLLVWRDRGWSLRFRPALVDWLALGYGALVVLSAIMPQHWLGGAATHRGVVLGVSPRPLARRRVLLRPRPRPDGSRRSQARRHRDRLGLRRRGLRADRHLRDPALVVAQLGCARLVPASSSASPTRGSATCPQNFVYNTGNGHVFRRLVSVFLSPLAASYMFVTALLLCAAWWIQLRPKLAVWIPTVALLFAGLLWTHSRSSYLALAVGLVVFAILRPHARVALAGAAVLVVVVGFAFVKAYPHIGPKTSFTPRELHIQEKLANAPGATAAVGSSGLEDASTSSHLRSLVDGIKTVLRHPQGYGPGNAGSTAARTDVTIKAGESTYTELGVDAGLLGGLLFVAWMLTVLVRLFRCTAWLSAAMVAMLVLGLQTDIIGVPWVVLRPLAAGRLAHVPPGLRRPRRVLKSVLRLAGTCLPWKGCGSRSSTWRSAPRHSAYSRSR